MPGQLLWHVLHPFWRTRNRIRQQSYQTPSWSWASIHGDVKFIPNTTSMEPLAKVLDANVKLLNIGKFGAVSDGYILIQGHLSQAEFALSDELLSETMPFSTFYCSLLKSQEGLTVGLSIHPDVFPDTSTSPSAWRTQLLDFRKGLDCRTFFILPLCRSSLGFIFGLI